MAKHRKDNLSFKGWFGLDEGDNVSLIFGMDIFSPSRWPEIAEAALSAGASDWQVKKWRTRRSVAAAWHLRLLRACEAAGVALSDEELLSTTSDSNGRDAA